MGLQDTPSMAAVPTQAVMTSAISPTPPKDGAASLEEGLLALTLQMGNQHDDDEMSNNSIADDMEYQYELDVDDALLLDYDDDHVSEPDENRLSRALRSWKTDYVITPLPIQMHTVHEPVFSARLGHKTKIRRFPSTESLDTQISLFSCSSPGSRARPEKKRRPLGRKKTPASTEQRGKPTPAGLTSRWVQLCKKGKGELDRFMMAQSHTLTMGFNLTDESEAFQLCEPDEQKGLYWCGQQDKLQFAARLKKSDSMTNIKDVVRGKKKQRVASAGAKKFHGKPLDFQELHRQMMNQKLAALNTAHQKRSSSRRSMLRSQSRMSLASSTSDIFVSAHSPRSNSPHAPHTNNTLQEEPPEKSVNMWKGDSQILAIDLKRELTAKVKHRIAVTTTALERVTGMGDDNQQRPYACRLPEFPAFIDDDFAVQPKIPQKIRISPHLSDVIKSDIKVRMGRPRYHEISIRDLQVWNQGQELGRAHRNLKVFNWLHSLREDEFDMTSVQQTINDVPPDHADVTFGEMVLIRAVDEPDIKPLYQQKKTFIR